MMRRGLLVILFLLTSLVSFAEYSDFYYAWAAFFYPNADDNSGLTLFPSLFIPMGGKYEGMATAFTAVSNDLSFIEANPAGSSLLTKTELGFLHHSWIMDSNVEGIVFATRLGDLGIAASGKFLYVPFNEKDCWGRAGGSGYYTETILTANVSYNFFKSFYFEGLAAGASIKLAYMGVPESIYPDQSVFTAMIDAGLLTRFNLLKFYNSSEKNFSIGAAFKNFSPFAASDPLPTTATFGIAYAPVRPLLLSVDFNLPISFDPAVPAERFYFAGGFALTFSPSVGVQGGVKFKGGNPMICLGANIDLSTVSFIVNYNIDLSNSLDPLDKFSLSAKFNLGDAGRGDKQGQINALYLDGVNLYHLEKYTEAIAAWEKVLTLDPDYTPARDYIGIAKKMLELRQAIVDQAKFN